ncbi:MAG TPA: hypothetical protein DCO77_05120 [Nitrospiraceae bacterium]|nr:hypothetical protein [Nitrospiraceae bacterium]
MKNKIDYLKFGFAVVLVIYGAIIAKDVTVYRFLDRVDLVSHEAGHLLFRWFGEFLMVLGGTLGQLIVPAGITLYFYTRREFYSSAVTLLWVGQNLFNISIYVKDAQAMALPLVTVGGGRDAIHDWNYLLRTVGLLRWDQTMGSLVNGLGIFIILTSVALAFYFSVEREEAEG